MSVLKEISNLIDSSFLNIMKDIQNCCDDDKCISIEMLENKMNNMISSMKEKINEVIIKEKIEKNNNKIIKKNKDEPKKPPTGFILWSQVQRPLLVSKNPGVKSTDIMKMLGSEWKKTPDNIKDKYNSIYNQKKEIYLEQMKKYKLDNNIEQKTSKKKISAFILFRDEKLENYRKNDSGIKIKDVIDEIKKEWNRADKDEYKSRSNQINEENKISKKPATKYTIFRNMRLNEIRMSSDFKIKIKDVEPSIKEEWKNLKKNKQQYCDFLGSIVDNYVEEVENKKKENKMEDNFEEKMEDNFEENKYNNHEKKKYKFNVDYLAKEVEKFYIDLYNQDGLPLYLISGGGIKDELDNSSIKYDEESLNSAFDILNDRISNKIVYIKPNKLATNKLCKLDVGQIFFYIRKMPVKDNYVNIKELKKVLDKKKVEYDDEAINLAVVCYQNPDENRVTL